MIGNRLKKLREEMNLLQKDLADKLNLTQQTISLYESNKREPDLETLEKIANCFDVSVDWLIGRTENKRPTNDYGIITKAYHNLDQSGLSEEDIEKVEEYIDLLKQKYNPDGTLKEKK